MKRVLTVVIGCFLLCFNLFASYPKNLFQSFLISEDYNNYYEILNNEEKIKRVFSSYENINTSIKNLNIDNDNKELFRAKINYNMAVFCIDNKLKVNQKDGLFYLEKGLDNLSKIKDMDKEIEALILSSKIQGYYTQYNFVKYMWSKGLCSSSLIDKIWKLDKDNPRIIILRAEQLLFTPSFYGGNVEVGKSMLKKLLASEKLLKEDAFCCVIDLAKIAKSENNKSLYDTYIEYSKALFPKNYYIDSL